MTDRMNAKLSITTRMLLLVALLEMAGCSNVLRSGLVNDNSILLPPSAERSIYVQIRNTSENQAATPSDIPARLSAKGYRIVTDPLQAAYWLQTQVVYCHKAGEECDRRRWPRPGSARESAVEERRSQGPAHQMWRPWARCSRGCRAVL